MKSETALGNYFEFFSDGGLGNRSIWKKKKNENNLVFEILQKIWNRVP